MDSHRLFGPSVPFKQGAAYPPFRSADEHKRRHTTERMVTYARVSRALREVAARDGWLEQYNTATKPINLDSVRPQRDLGGGKTIRRQVRPPEDDAT